MISSADVVHFERRYTLLHYFYLQHLKSSSCFQKRLLQLHLLLVPLNHLRKQVDTPPIWGEQEIRPKGRLCHFRVTQKIIKRLRLRSLKSQLFCFAVKNVTFVPFPHLPATYISFFLHQTTSRAKRGHCPFYPLFNSGKEIHGQSSPGNLASQCGEADRDCSRLDRVVTIPYPMALPMLKSKPPMGLYLDRGLLRSN